MALKVDQIVDGPYSDFVITIEESGWMYRKDSIDPSTSQS